MIRNIIHREDVTPDFWAHMLELSQAKEKPGMERYPWASKVIAKDELKHIVIYSEKLYRPYYQLLHPVHKLPYVMDKASAEAIAKKWNTRKRPKHDHIKTELVIFSCANNRADYKA